MSDQYEVQYYVSYHKAKAASATAKKHVEEAKRSLGSAKKFRVDAKRHLSSACKDVTQARAVVQEAGKVLAKEVFGRKSRSKGKLPAKKQSDKRKSATTQGEHPAKKQKKSQQATSPAVQGANFIERKLSLIESRITEMCTTIQSGVTAVSALSKRLEKQFVLLDGKIDALRVQDVGQALAGVSKAVVPVPAVSHPDTTAKKFTSGNGVKVS